jgi:hypothetical protein
MTRHFRRNLSLLLVCSASAQSLACSSSDDQKEPAAAEVYLGLKTPTPEDGFQVRSKGHTIPAGQDMEFCEVAELPGEVDDVYYVNTIEFANAKGSHHLIIDAAKDGSAAETTLAAHELGDRVECLSSQSQFGDGFEFVGGIQTPYLKEAYPPGVGRKFHGKQRFVFDYHYLNTSDEDVEARSAVNFHLTKKEDVQHIAQIFSFNNVTIDTPPAQTGKFTGECHVKTDIKLAQLTRHTHRWGKEYSVWYAGGAKDGETVFTSPDYEHDVDHFFDTPVDVKADEGFRFECNYENTETHALRFGPNATDEMCILFGIWWSETDNDPKSQDCVMTQVDDGGIARPGDSGSFPAPTADEVAACKAGTASDDGSTFSEACLQCSCESCGSVFVKCAEDADCKEILACVTGSGCGATGTCVSDCQDVINAHSPGTGPLIQVSECLTSQCPVCSNAPLSPPSD